MIIVYSQSVKTGETKKMLDFVNDLSKYSRSELSSLLVDLYTKLRENKQRVDMDVVYTIRRQRCRREIDNLEVDMCLDGEFANLATVLFVIETQMVLKLKMNDFEQDLEENNLLKISDFCSNVKNLVQNPENQFLRMPLSQVLENLQNICSFEVSDNIKAFEKVIEQMFFRACFLLNIELTEEDLDDDSYVVHSENKIMASWKLASVFRAYFDTIFDKIEKFHQFDIEHEIACEDEEKLKKIVREMSNNFEKEYFIETYTEFVISNKICSNLHRELYNIIFNVSVDDRKVSSYFFGKEIVKNYTNFKNIDALFEENLEYIYEFSILLILKQNFDLNCFDENVYQNPLNRREFFFKTTENKFIAGGFLKIIQNYIKKKNISLL
jgi:hypothetical protein